MVFGQTKKLQDEIFCLTEERDYFQAKFLEQVSEIAHLNESLGRAKKEIDRLRKELMERGVEMDDDDGGGTNTSLDLANATDVGMQTSTPSSPRKRTPKKSKKKKKSSEEDNEDVDGKDEGDEEDKKDDTSELTADEDEEEEDSKEGSEDDDDEEEDPDKEADEIRQSAEKLLQWASYRSLSRTSASATPEHSSISSPLSNSAADRGLSRLGYGIPSSVQLDAALPNHQEDDEEGTDKLKNKKRQGGGDDDDEIDNDDDDKTFSSTASSNTDVEDNEDEQPSRREGTGRKLMEKFENLVTSL